MNDFNHIIYNDNVYLTNMLINGSLISPLFNLKEPTNGPLTFWENRCKAKSVYINALSFTADDMMKLS